MKTTLAVAIALSCTATAASANTESAPEVPKKQRFLEAKIAAQVAQTPETKDRWDTELDKRLGTEPEMVINVYNTWTREYLPVSLEEEADVLAPKVCVDQFFRCHFSNQPTGMDPRLFKALIKAARYFKKARVDIVSGFRSPKYNLILRKKGRQVARRSQHTQGHAVDFRVRGVPVKKLHRWARSLRLGGVGFYPSSSFIHIDVGPIRFWQGR